MPYKDPEKKKAHDRAYKEAHREKYRAYLKAYDATKRDRAAISDRQKAMRSKNPERARTWERESYRRRYDRNVLWFCERAARRRAAKSATTTERIDYKQVLRDSKGVCGICREPLDLFGVDYDHIVPLSRGGTHTRDNIQASHQRCNRSKGARVG